MDESAIEKPRKEVIDAVVDVLTNHWYNPNSSYEEGMEARRMINNAKRIISKEINCEENNLIMCNSGSEANTMAIMGILRSHKCYSECITSCIEHASITENPYTVCRIDVDMYGNFDIRQIAMLRNRFVSLGLANSEIGTIQDIEKICSILHKNNCIVHTDATAAFGKIKIDVKDLGVDLMTFASQKIGGVLGAACLYVNPNIQIEPLIYGHNKLMNGTPNTAAIVGFGKAVELLDYNILDVQSSVMGKRDYLIGKLLLNKDIYFNGGMANRLPNNLNIGFNNIRLDNQQLVAMLNVMSVCCSAGSACNSGSAEPSKVLLAIGLTPEQANHSIRLTISDQITYSELDTFVAILNGIVDSFKITEEDN